VQIAHLIGRGFLH